MNSSAIEVSSAACTAELLRSSRHSIRYAILISVLGLFLTPMRLLLVWLEHFNL
jgi:hypothetical protein